MQHLDLRIGGMVQGEFDPAQLNVLLAFQVNCPGCFLHAIPLAALLYDRYKKEDVTVLGLSTVFEDFSLNTMENTRVLLEEAGLVGETAEHFQRLGMDQYETPIVFPVAMDALGPDGRGLTFGLNHFPGTSTWVLFTKDFQMIRMWFGHQNTEVVTALIDDLLSHPPSNLT